MATSNARQSIPEDPETQGTLATGPTGKVYRGAGPVAVPAPTTPRPRASNEAIAWLVVQDVTPAVYDFGVYVAKKVRYATAADGRRKVTPGEVFCYPMQATMARELGCSVRQVKRLVRALREVGLMVRQRVRPYGAAYVFPVTSAVTSGVTSDVPSHREPRTNHVGTPSELQVSGRVLRRTVRTPPVTTAAPKKGSPVPSPSPLIVVATPDQAQAHIDAMLEFIKDLKAKNTSPTEASTFNIDPVIEARQEEQDRLYHEPETLHLPPPKQKTGVHNADTTA